MRNVPARANCGILEAVRIPVVQTLSDRPCFSQVSAPTSSFLPRLRSGANKASRLIGRRIYIAIESEGTGTISIGLFAGGHSIVLKIPGHGDGHRTFEVLKGNKVASKLHLTLDPDRGILLSTLRLPWQIPCASIRLVRRTDQGTTFRSSFAPRFL